jgi:hypothetical protein
MPPDAFRQGFEHINFVYGADLVDDEGVPSRRGLTFGALAVGLLFAAIAVLACLSPAQADTFWALRAGEDIWRTGHVPRVDTYSFTAAGRPWPDHEWLWQAAAFALYWMGGFPAFTLVVALAVLVAYAVVYRLMVGSWRRRVALLVLSLPLATSAWALRPQVTGLALLAALLALVVRERWWAIPPLFALWANLHGGVILGGFVMLAVVATAAIWFRDKLLAAALATLGGGAATLMTPLGTGLWSFVARWLETSRQTAVSEWAPVSANTMDGVVFWVLALVLVVLVVRRRRMPSTWPDRVLVVSALALLVAAARAARNVSPFMLVAPAAASRLLGPGRPSTEPEADRPRLNLAIALAGGALAVAAVVVVWTLPLRALGWQPIRPAAAQAISGCPKPVYNGYNEGGYLVWFVRDQPVFLDGRHDPYPTNLLIEDREVERGADPRSMFGRFGIRCAALSSRAILAGTLAAQGWTPRYHDDQWTVLVPPSVERGR